ncbi:His Kinase A domain containing protein [Mortierella sp. AD094]|nr:His Kinase A domain containing protein [Mortierella sp. AD094]
MTSPPSSTPSSENMPLQDQGASAQPTTPQRQRPRFLRAITSPLPVLGAFITQTTEDSATLHPHQPESISGSNDDITDSNFQTDHQRPLFTTNDVSLRSISSSIIASFLPSSFGSTLAPPLSPTSPSQRRTSIADTLLKERRWSKGQILNWMPGFTKGQYSDAFETHPSPITTCESAPRSLKSIQRHKSESSELSSLSTCGDSSNRLDGCAVLGLDTVSASGNMCNNQNHLKVNEVRSKHISESKQCSSFSSPLTMSSTNNSGTGRLSGLAQRTQSSFMEDEDKSHSSIDPSGSPTADPWHAFINHRSLTGDSTFKHQTRQACLETEQAAEFNTWDDFLIQYGQGLFPNTQNQRHPRSRLEPEYPPLPDYATGAVDANVKSPPLFLAPPLPPTEERRLKALYSYQILEAGSDVNFQRVAQLVSTVLGVSGCMISLVDHKDIFIKAPYCAENMECRRETSLCGHAILRPPGDPLVVLDASRDWRFKNLPIVKGAPNVRFYAGAALTTSDGLNIGSLCVFDTKPRTEFSEKDKAMLVDFAAVVMREIELWNDQVQLCTRNRMMRDVTRWVRGCLGKETTPSSPLRNAQLEPNSDASTPSFTQFSSTPTTGPVESSTFLASPAIIAGSVSKDSVKPSYKIPSSGATLPTPTGSPMLLSPALGSDPNHKPMENTERIYQDRLQDEAFPSACNMIQETMNVDAVYLVQASFNRSPIPFSGSNVLWNYLEAEDRATGFTGSVGSGESLQDPSGWTLACLASSRKFSDNNGLPMSNESTQGARQEGKSWICTYEGCRPHRVGELRPDAVGPLWSRDVPLISEILSCARQEEPQPSPSSGKCSLYTCYDNFDDNDLFVSSVEDPASKPVRRRRKAMLCHTFQGTLRELSAGYTSPYKSCVVMPIHGPSSSSRVTNESEEPWAYFVVLTSSHTKQFSVHERIYLKNFGSCLIAEVLKRRVETADKAKGIFIKSISHELRTPLHIILGILELLHSNEGNNLSHQQLSMIASAEASGKGLIDIINNIIDLADLDPDNNANSGDSSNDGRSQTPLPELYTHVAEIDIRDLCEQVAGTMATSCTDKNLVIIPSWTKPSLASLSSSVSTAPTSNSSTSAGMRIWNSNQGSSGGDVSSSESQCGFSGTGPYADQKPALELLVAMDEPESDPDQETPWTFMLNIPVTKRILTQLLENALKFTTTGFVEISAVSPPLSMFSVKPPTPESRPILFTVRDTGRGISPEFVQAHLFQRFSQEDPLQVGTGLGLALVKLLIESLGGWLEIWSEGIEGKGCVVRVLIWATPSKNTIKSLRDEKGIWQEKSCRFYTGEPTVSTDRLWKIMGERMMSQDFNMNVQRGNEQDISPEDMLKDLSDQSKCELIILNDDLSRLKAFLLHCADQHTTAKLHGITPSATLTPLLMLTSISTAKKAQNLVEAYKKTWDECGGLGRPAIVILMPKPIGPLKLMRCLRACFAEEEDYFAEHDALEPMSNTESAQTSTIPLLRSVTLPHITTMALGVHDTRRLSAGTMIKSSFKFPTSPATIARLGETAVPPHSPGGLVLPPRFIIPTTSDNTASKAKAVREQSETKSRPPRSIKNFMSQRNGSYKAASGSKKQAPVPAVPENSVAPQSKPLGLDRQDQFGVSESMPRVLIVEDNMTNRMILRTFLKKQGISVVEAENGKLGVERFQEEVWRRQGRSGFEFVLMDIQMPVMDGNLATKRIREFELSMVKQHGLSTPEPPSPGRSSTVEEVPESEKRRYRPTTIFALTGLASDEDKRLAFKCGVNGYLTKPVSLKVLGTLLSSCHSNNADATATN